MFLTSLKTAFLFVLLVSSPGPSLAATDYVALGDDYSSGVGAGSYDPSSGSCMRSARSYPALWATAHSPSSFAFMACRGACTGDVLSGQLGALNAATGLVSLTIGARDAGLADTLTTCVLHGERACLARTTLARSYIAQTLPGELDQVYTAIRSKAASAHVVVLGYPPLYSLNVACVEVVSETARAAINSVIEDLNAAIAKRAADHGFTFGDVGATFAGHEICSSSPWLYSVVVPVDESYHPTADGQSEGYLPAFATTA